MRPYESRLTVTPDGRDARRQLQLPGPRSLDRLFRECSMKEHRRHVREWDSAASPPL
jgi:hypothetical protein